MGRARRKRKKQDQKLVDYYVKYANPYKLLMAVGFVRNPWGIGYHIVECQKVNGFPARRLHAYVVDNRISMHHDLSLKGRKHITSHTTPTLKNIRERIITMDESFVNDLPRPPMRYRVRHFISRKISFPVIHSFVVCLRYVML